MRKFIWVAILLMVLGACSQPKQGSNKHSETEDDNYVPNDIAMTIRSLIDAINIGEKLDSASYDFSGVLTDGTGRPLYTSLHGTPGEWVVSVMGEGNAVIRNTDLGDVLPTDLISYISQTNNLDMERQLEACVLEGEDTAIESYDFGKGMIKFETRYETASNGMECAWFSVSIKKWED